MAYGSLYAPAVKKPRIFVSYHHGGDQFYYNEFSRIFTEVYDVIYDNSLQRQIDSDNVDYVIRRIREDFITGTSCTVVLCGVGTPNRKYVDWEIKATLEKNHGLIGVKLPPVIVIENGCEKPPRLQDNLDTGYAKWVWWETLLADPASLGELIQSANATQKSLIDNSRERRLRNG